MKFYKTSVRIFLFYMLILPIFLKGSIITSSGVVVGIEQDEIITWKNVFRLLLMFLTNVIMN